MRACLIWVGRESARDPEGQWCAEYLKRLRPYLSLDVKAIKSAGSREMSIAETRRRESERIQACFLPGDKVVLCDERGRGLSSASWAAQLDRFLTAAPKRLVFVIGGSMGVSSALRQRAEFVLSLSKMTLPHGLARVLFLEQLYRGFCIRAGHPYHHEG